MDQLRQAAEYAAEHGCALALAPARPNLQIVAYRGNRQVSRILTWTDIGQAKVSVLMLTVREMCGALEREAA